MMANVRAERLLKIPAEPSPELDAMISSRLSAQARRVCEVMMARERDPFYSCAYPGAAAQTRVVSLAGIRFGSWESALAQLVSPAQAEILAYARAAYPQRRSSNREWSPKPEFGWIPANLYDLSKG